MRVRVHVNESRGASPLFKYLPEEFAELFVEQGLVLFRSLSYFRRVEHEERGDEIEGVHVDAPTRPVSIDNLSTGKRLVGNFRFLNSIDQDRVFAFCCSQVASLGLMKRFGATACVQILDPSLFFLRCSIAAKRHFPLDPPGLLHGPVEYFDPAGPTMTDVKDPTRLPFFKHFGFGSQVEYRGVIARRGGLSLLERIAHPDFTFAAEIAQAKPSERPLRLGSLREVAKILSPSELTE